MVVEAGGGRKLEGEGEKGDEEASGRAAWKFGRVTAVEEEEIVVAVTGVALSGNRMAAAI